MSVSDVHHSPSEISASHPVQADERHVRPLRPSDRQALHALIVDTGMFTEEEVDVAMELIDIAVDNPGQNDYTCFCYDAGEKVQGYYCVGPTPATDGTFDLYWLAVERTAQGGGIGRVLNHHAERLVKSMGGRLLIAETSSQAKYEKTRQFYLRQGYKEVARIPQYYRPGDDLVVYGKYLT